MKSCVRHTSARLWLCAALALLVFFFSVAVYTPLHVHKNGDPKQCSLNNVEHQVADSVAPVLELPEPAADSVAAHAVIAVRVPSVPPQIVTARGPPPPSSGFPQESSISV